MATYIITVGTSILTNMAKMKNLDYQSVSLENVKDYLKSMPWDKLSAELNTLKRLNIQKNDNFFILYSDDEEGKKSSKFLKYVLEANGFYFVFEKKIEYLTKDFTQFSKKGVKNLINTIVSIIEENIDVKIVATGGYKAETAYATLIGMLFRIPVFYIHEDFKSIIEMPPMPINFDIEIIKKNLTKIYKVFKVDKKTAVKLIGEMPEMMNVLFEKDGNRYVFSPIGSLIMRFYANKNIFTEVSSDFPISVYKAHSTLFGDNIRKLSDIKEADVRKILKKALTIAAGNVIRIIFDEFSPHFYDETCLLFKELVGGNMLKYELRCKLGKQIVKFEVVEEAIDFVKEMLGEKLYL
ncbi:putative CRISPR-associated protein [Deferribacter abyssi]|uniref:putative CRISPR-associated protein n=1 Tax=Deferribacter abyssi TaxID=213806 RepID=UPI003C2A6271